MKGFLKFPIVNHPQYPPVYKISPFHLSKYQFIVHRNNLENLCFYLREILSPDGICCWQQLIAKIFLI